MNEQLPHNIGAERSLLGGILLDNDLMWDVASIITKDDFYEPGNGEIYILLRDQIEANRAATPQTILADMAQDRDIGGIRASEYLNTLYAERAPARQVVLELARSIADNGLKRRAMRVLTDAYSDFGTAPVSTTAHTLIDRLDATIMALRSGLSDLGIRHIAEYATAVLDAIDESMKSDRDIGLPVGLSALQNLTDTLMPGKVYSLAGAPASGKSALVQQVLEYICGPGGKIGMWVQAEMEGTEVASRSMAAITGIPGNKIERALLDQREVSELYAARDKMKGLNLYVDAAVLPSVTRIRARATRMKRMQGLDILVIDHLLYLGKAGDRMTDNDSIPINMRELKALAKELRIPIIVLMPLKGTFVMDWEKMRRPNMGDLVYPAAIDSNSDAIIFVHRPEMILKRNPPQKSDDKAYSDWSVNMERWKGLAEIYLGKRRDGGMNEIQTCFFDGKRVRFDDNAGRAMIREDAMEGQRGLFTVA